MREQDNILDSILQTKDEKFLMEKSMTTMKSSMGGTNGKGGVRQSHYISVTDKLFDVADRAKHDHTPFVLAVVIYHMILRSLHLRVLYHRAAIALQKRYRYLKMKGKKAGQIAPAICIQRFWRGTRVRLKMMRMDDAAEKIQHNVRTIKWNRRSKYLLDCTLKIQRVWLGAIVRCWLRRQNRAATTVQRFVRGNLVRAALDKTGRGLVKKSREELENLMKQKKKLSETMYLAKCAVVA